MTVRWRVLLRPRWLAWHLFIVLAAAGMVWLGDWQLRRALGGNALSWAYTFEWPLFAIFAVYFWVKSVRDELRLTEVGGENQQAGNGAESGAAALTADEYVAHLKAEVSGHGRWHGWR